MGDVTASAALGSGKGQATLTQAIAQYLGQTLVAIGNDVTAQNLVQLTRKAFHIVVNLAGIGG